jgi:hypothetical protein
VIWTRLYNITVFKKHFKRQFERLPEWECLVIGADLEWVKPVQGVRDGVGKLRPLLQAPSRPRPQRERLGRDSNFKPAHGSYRSEPN